MLAYFLINVLLAVLWMCMWGLFDIWTMLAGFFFGYLLLGAVSRTWYPDGKGYGSKLFNLISFGFYFIRILIQANLTVAKEVVTPRFNMTPRFVRYPVKDMTPLQITSLANATYICHCDPAQGTSYCVTQTHNQYARVCVDLFGASPRPTFAR